MGDWLARWLRERLLALRRGRADHNAATFAALDHRIDAAERDLREIEARLDLLELQADMRRGP